MVGYSRENLSCRQISQRLLGTVCPKTVSNVLSDMRAHGVNSPDGRGGNGRRSWPSAMLGELLYIIYMWGDLFLDEIQRMLAAKGFHRSRSSIDRTIRRKLLVSLKKKHRKSSKQCPMARYEYVKRMTERGYTTVEVSLPLSPFPHATPHPPCLCVDGVHCSLIRAGHVQIVSVDEFGVGNKDCMRTRARKAKGQPAVMTDDALLYFGPNPSGRHRISFLAGVGHDSVIGYGAVIRGMNTLQFMDIMTTKILPRMNPCVEGEHVSQQRRDPGQLPDPQGGQVGPSQVGRGFPRQD